MVLDTSALIAIIRDEPERDAFIDLLAAASDPVMSAPTLVETRIVAQGKSGPEGPGDVTSLISAAGIRTVAFDADQAALAHSAWERFGKGRHPAGLNLGDCFSYALAKSMDRQLLFKGDDFEATDIESAMRRPR